MQQLKENKIRIVWLCPFPVDKILGESEFKRIRKYHPAPWIVNTINALKDDNKIDLHVVTLNAHITRNTIIFAEGVTYHIIKRGINFLSIGYPNSFRLDLFTFFYRETKELKKVLIKLKPDLIHSFGSEVPYGIASVRSNYKYIFTLQGIMIKMSKLFPSSFNYKLMSILERKTIIKSDFFLSQSTTVTNHILKINPNAKIFKTFYPVDDCFFEVSPIQNKDFDLVFVGNISDSNKGFHVLLNSFTNLILSGFTLKMAVIGSGSAQNLKQVKKHRDCFQLNNSISFLGYLSHKEIADIYARSSILVVPSLFESYSMTAAEGLASGVCVVASNTGGLKDIIEHNQNGILFNAEDVDDLTIKLTRLLNDKCFQFEIAMKARLFAKDKFSKSRIVEDHLLAYRAAIEK